MKPKEIEKDIKAQDDVISRQSVLELLDWYAHEYDEIESYIQALYEDVQRLWPVKAESEGKEC